MSGGEVARLAALERTLVGAAARQAQRRRRRRRRLVALIAVAAPLALAAGSVAATQGFFGGADQQLSALRDDRLVSVTTPPGLLEAMGSLPRDHASSRSWVIAGRRVTGYTTSGGSFCFRFGPFTGGCVQPGALTPASPVAVTVDYGPKTFRVYGLAFDGVTRIGLRTGGATHRVLLARNAIYLEDDSLGGLGGFRGTLIVHLRGGGVTRVPLHSAGGLRPSKKFLPVFPGSLPAGNTAA